MTLKAQPRKVGPWISQCRERDLEPGTCSCNAWMQFLDNVFSTIFWALAADIALGCALSCCWFTNSTKPMSCSALMASGLLEVLLEVYNYMLIYVMYSRVIELQYMPTHLKENQYNIKHLLPQDLQQDLRSCQVQRDNAAGAFKEVGAFIELNLVEVDNVCFVFLCVLFCQPKKTPDLTFCGVQVLSKQATSEAEASTFFPSGIVVRAV